jgi:hypothetical protein
MLLKGNLKATSGLLQDDIFQDVFEIVGLFCGYSHCNIGDAKEECVWIHQIKPNRITKIVVTGKNQEIQNFARASAAVLSGCLLWLLLPAPQHLCLNVLQVGQCLEPTNDPEEKTTSIGLVILLRQLSHAYAAVSQDVDRGAWYAAAVCAFAIVTGAQLSRRVFLRDSAKSTAVTSLVVAFCAVLFQF